MEAAFAAMFRKGVLISYQNCFSISSNLAQIYDATQKRYEVPIDTPKVTHKASETDYSVLFPSYGFGFGVTRKSTDLPM